MRAILSQRWSHRHAPASSRRPSDPAGLFNSNPDGNTRRAIDIREGEVDGEALKALVREAAALNEAR